LKKASIYHITVSYSFQEGGMKKFFVFLMCLIILGGLAFFLGWAQLAVPPGSYGLMRSKTHGVDSRLIREGEFRWVWYKLIPTNVVIDLYRLDRVDHAFTFRNSLPSGSAYAALAGITADFSYNVSGDLSFSLKPDALVSLVVDYNIGSQEDLDSLEKTLAGEIEGFILRRLELKGDTPQNLEEILSTGSSPALESAILEQFPAIENLSCRIKTASFPDFTLYRQVREIFETFLSQEKEYLDSGLREKAEKQIDSRLRFDELERYGELLTKYPVLVQYLAIKHGVQELPDLPGIGAGD
jgi:hypothetical protein